MDEQSHFAFPNLARKLALVKGVGDSHRSLDALLAQSCLGQVLVMARSCRDHELVME
jgi:hypothetical protein|tara:strand:+ start:537 stop:707 length:171 start_codon:yes stop_codon:yes gene_type:complete